MKIWIMCGDSESGDHYHAMVAWKHEPTKEDINRVLVQFDVEELEENEEEDTFPTFELDGKKYLSYVWEEISVVELGE